MRSAASQIAIALSLGATASLVPFEQASATPTQAADVSQDDAGLAPIVVTAERRAENSQKVPSAIQHIDGKTIADAGYIALTDLQYLAPSVQYDPTNGAAFQVRGVGSQSFDFSNAKSVSVVLDDVVMDAQRANHLIGMADIAGVDVLEGPQGTLFGMNSTSVVIRQFHPDRFRTDQHLRLCSVQSGPGADQEVQRGGPSRLADRPLLRISRRWLLQPP